MVKVKSPVSLDSLYLLVGDGDFMVSRKLEQADEDFIAKANQQSKKGQYLTPIVVADRLAQDLLDLSLSPIKEIHDLGCGPGSLSSAMLRIQSDVRVVGYDIDKSAINEYNQRFPGIGDAVFRDLLVEPSIGPLSAVISNPPYLLSRRMGKERTSEIRNVDYFKTSTGKLNTFSLFIELALRELCENGVAAFIVPIGIANLKDHEAIRKLLIEESEEIRLTWMTESNCFKEQNVSVDTCLLSFRKGKSKAKIEIREWDGHKTTFRTQIQSGDFSVFPTRALLEAEEQSGTPITEEFEIVVRGFNWRNGWENLRQEEKDTWGEELYPVVKGGDILPNGQLKSELIEINYLMLEGHDFLSRTCDFTLHSSTRPRLLLADITSKIKVTFTTKPVLPMNSVKIIFHKEDSENRLHDLMNHLRKESTFKRLKLGQPNLHLTKGNLVTLLIPDGDA